MWTLDTLLSRARPGDRVLVRADLNVPLCSTAEVSETEGEELLVGDDTRIRATLPTLERLREAQLRIVVCSHLGRPKGVDPQLSLQPVAKALGDLLGTPVRFAGGLPVGTEASELVARLEPGEIGLLENLRFDPREKQNEATFAAGLVASIDSFVNNAFGTCHRAHASVVGTAARLPSFAGALVERELSVLRKVRDHCERPFWVILGGAKVSDKIGVIEHLCASVDGFVVGGGMANTFLAARGVPVGGSRIESEALDVARKLLERKGDLEWRFPIDAVLGTSLDDTQPRTIPVGDDPGDSMFLDVGPKTLASFREALGGARTIFWNGPPGVFEKEPFAEGTRALASFLAAHSGTVVVGGGDTAAAARKFGIENDVTHVCTGGGAALEFLEGKDLPGLSALEAAARRGSPDASDPEALHPGAANSISDDQ